MKTEILTTYITRDEDTRPAICSVSAAELGEQGNAVMIFNVTTAEDYRRRGYARRLLTEVLATYPGRKFALSVDEKNAPENRSVMVRRTLTRPC